MSPVDQHQPPAVGLIPRLHLCAICDPFSVRRIDAAPIIAGIGCDSVWVAGSAHRYREKVAICAERFVLVCIRREAQFLAIRRKRNRLRLAEAERRHIVIGPGSEVARRSSAGRRYEKVAAFPVPPRIPVPVEQLFVNVSFHFGLFLFRVAPRVARVISAIGIDAGNECDPSSIGRPNLVVRAGGNGSYLRRYRRLREGSNRLGAPRRARQRKCQVFAIQATILEASGLFRYASTAASPRPPPRRSICCSHFDSRSHPEWTPCMRSIFRLAKKCGSPTRCIETKS